MAASTGSGEVIQNGGVQYVYSGGTTSDVQVNNGGQQVVYSSGTANATTVSGGGLLEVANGGTASGAQIQGLEYVDAGGSDVDATISSGGTQNVYGSASGASVQDGGSQYVGSGGSATGTTVSVGGALTVDTSGTATSATIYGSEVVSAGGHDVSAVLSGGEQDVYGSADGVSVEYGGLQVVESGGVVSGTVVHSGGTIELEGTGSAIDTTLEAGASEVVCDNASASNIDVTSDVWLFAVSGGTVSGTTVENGGHLIVDFDGSATATVIHSGGEEDIYGSGIDTSATVDSGALQDIFGTASGDIIDGTEIVEDGGSAVSATIDSGGFELVVFGGTTTDVVINGGKVELTSGATADGSITFEGSGGELIVDDVAMPGATVSGFVAGDSIDLAGVQYVSGTVSVHLNSGNVLEVTSGTSTYDIQLDPSHDYSTDTFEVQDDGNGGTLVIEDNTPCYCRGTRILTPKGEVPVEELTIGDKVVTRSGEAKPIRWIGRRAYDGRFIAGNRQVLPVRIAAGAFCPGLPARDLWVSPGHALYLGGVLVACEHLLNGMTIVQLASVERVEYFHIELDAHDIVFAEGAPAETFVDCDNRLMFSNGRDYAVLYPDDDRPHWAYCAARLEGDSPELSPIRAALLQRAEALGHVLDIDPDLHLVVDGEIVRPAHTIGSVYRFEIPPGGGAVWLASRTTIPAEVVAGSSDRRRLGVPVKRILLYDADLSVEVWHSHPELSDGFSYAEATLRWTEGLARLPEAWRRLFGEGCTLEVHLFPSGLPYPAAAPAPNRPAAPVPVPKPRKQERAATARRKRA